MNDPNLPSRELADRQSEWLRDARSRLLRRAGITRRESILELGAGWGQVSRELEKRSGGTVLALDQNRHALQGGPHDTDRCLVADARQLPLVDDSFDLVFCQCFLLWAKEPDRVLAEAVRVLKPGGAFTAIEPDYGGMMEYPSAVELKQTWIDALHRAGADPHIGRKLPTLLGKLGLRAEVQFFNRLHPAADARFDLLLELPLTESEQRRVEAAREAMSENATVHLPFWMVYGEKTV